MPEQKNPVLWPWQTEGTDVHVHVALPGTPVHLLPPVQYPTPGTCSRHCTALRLQVTYDIPSLAHTVPATFVHGGSGGMHEQVAEPGWPIQSCEVGHIIGVPL
jgi:hypothetical protein